MSEERPGAKSPRRGSRFCPFTVLTLLALWLSATATESIGARLSGPFLRALGWSTEDLFAGRWQRLVISALVTHGGWVLARASFLVALFVGLLERRRGTATAAVTFWAGHILTLAALGLGLSLFANGSEASADLVALRDVGPSAGHLACAGLLLGGLDHPWPRRLLGALLVALAVLPPLFDIDPRLDLLADLAHLLAFFGAVGVATLLRAHGDGGVTRRG